MTKELRKEFGRASDHSTHYVTKLSCTRTKFF